MRFWIKGIQSLPVSAPGSCYQAVLCDYAEGGSLQEAVVEGQYRRVVQLRQQLGLLSGSNRLVGSKVTQRNLLQHLPRWETQVRGTFCRCEAPVYWWRSWCSRQGAFRNVSMWTSALKLKDAHSVLGKNFVERWYFCNKNWWSHPEGETANVSTKLKTGAAWSQTAPPQGGNQLLLTEQAVSPALVKLVSRSAGEMEALVY